MYIQAKICNGAHAALCVSQRYSLKLVLSPLLGEGQGWTVEAALAMSLSLCLL